MNASKQHWLTPNDPKSSPKSGSSPHRRPRWEWLLPPLFLILLGLVFAYAYRDRLAPGIPVDSAPAIPFLSEETNAPSSDAPSALANPQMLFQATGWIEPEPQPIRVPALYSGVVKKVHALEGQAVAKGDLLVSLIDEDAKLALRGAEATLAQAQATEAFLQASRDLMLTRKRSASQEHESASAQLAEHRDAAQRLRRLKPGTVSDQARLQAQLQEQGQSAVVARAATSIEERETEIVMANAQIEIQRERIAAAEIARDEAQLALDRTRILAPVDGVIMRMPPTPGQRLMLLMDQPDASTAAILYQTNHLQLRVDIPLAEAAHVAIGQRTRITCNLLPDQTFEGTVTRIVGEADVQRNTLQVKVRLHAPDPRLRPEMLCRAAFFSNTSEESSGQTASLGPHPLGLYVPASAVVEREGLNARVWVVSQDHRHAQHREVRLGNQIRNGDLPVLEGLRPGERVILNPPATLTHGIRIQVRSTPPTSSHP